jgi:two-component system nitrogen regulation sensor histidine kinase NtrY
MKKRLMLGSGAVLLAISALLVAWLGSFNRGQFSPADSHQTVIFWVTSALIFILMVALGFILFRELVKLYIARQSNQQGSRIRTKLVVGALALSCVPAVFLVLFSFEVLSHSMDRWFTNPVDQTIARFIKVADLLRREMQDEVNAQAALLAAEPQLRRTLAGTQDLAFLEHFVAAQQAESAAVYGPDGAALIARSGPAASPGPNTIRARAPIIEQGRVIGYAELTARLPLDVADQLAAIEKFHGQALELKINQKNVKFFYNMVMGLITIFVLFFATWIAFFLSKQISVPISALLDAAYEVSKGNLKRRVEVRAADELGALVRAFNQMMEDLDSGNRELDRRRRFIEAILESIPTGVLSIGADGSIHHVNRALSKIFTPQSVARANRLEDLFSREDTAELKYLMKRARRTGTASRELEMRTETRKLHLAVTVSALEEKLTSGFVVVLEDTSELLRAQKSAAWHEVARRVAHEIKNPLTPIALSAERIARQVDRLELPAATSRILRECTSTISKSVESVKTLVDEFSQFARFPTAQPVRCDLNTLVEEALTVFQGRLDGIEIRTNYTPGLPPVNLDPDQFRRVVVNLVDNAAEAMQDSLVKQLLIATQPGVAETVELVIADSGPGVSPDDKEKLFLPYFSTKNRGTGLGLAIVSHILAEHNAHIRVEDNQPAGARFTVEIPALLEPEGAEAPGRAAANV